MRDGLARGHKVVYLCDRDDPADVVAELAETDDRVRPALATGQLDVRHAAAEDALALALAEGYPALSLTGEMTWGLSAAPGSEQRTAAGAMLRLAGELDFACADVLGGVLDAHFHGQLEFDLADVTFIDVAGLRALRGRKGQAVTISAASEPVRRLIGLLAWDTDPGIRLVEAA